MARYIVKLSEGEQSWYLEWSSIVDAPISYGVSLEKFKEEYQEEYGRSSMRELEERLVRVEKKGTSSRMHDSAEELVSFNRAGKNETQLTMQQIIDHYCKTPDFEFQEDFEAYDRNKPEGKKLHDD